MNLRLIWSRLRHNLLYRIGSSLRRTSVLGYYKRWRRQRIILRNTFLRHTRRKNICEKKFTDKFAFELKRVKMTNKPITALFGNFRWYIQIIIVIICNTFLAIFRRFPPRVTLLFFYHWFQAQGLSMQWSKIFQFKSLKNSIS